MRKTIPILIVLCVSIVAALIATTVTVKGDDMSPSIVDGDRLWIVPWGQPYPGDVVQIQDPLDPNRNILRRVLAVDDQTITYDSDTIRVNKRRLRRQAMGTVEPHFVAQETLWAKKPKKGHSWLTRLVSYPATHWRAEPVTVPKGHLYLLADDRDSAVDSRWWGTIPSTAVQGIVRVRWGEASTWRSEFEWMVGTAPIRD